MSELNIFEGLVGHDEYGKGVVPEATKGEAAFSGAGQSARIDGTVGGEIAVEIESRVSKQVRRALLDLICHPYPKKLLVLLPVHMNSPQVTADQCPNILSWFCPAGSFRVLLLKGSGSNPQLPEDAAVVAAALADLRSPGDRLAITEQG